MTTIQTDWHHTTSMDGVVIEGQSCDEGWGLDAKIVTSGLYSVQGMYAWKYRYDRDWGIAILPKAGLAYVDHSVYELPLRTPFSVSLGIAIDYKAIRISMEYWHLSNGNIRSPNIGIDGFITLFGVKLFP